MLRAWICFGFLLNFATVVAQPADSLYARYMQAVGGSAQLFNGSEYDGVYQQTEGSAFWDGGRFTPSLIVYEGVAYHNVPLTYDQVKDAVLIKGFQGLTLRLDNRRVDSFVLGGHHFVWLRGHAPALAAGIYERVLADSSVTFYVKRAKRVQRAFDAADADRIVGVNRYFVQRRSAVYAIENEKDLLRMFAEDKSHLQAFWKSKRLSFSEDPERFISQTLLFWLPIHR